MADQLERLFRALVLAVRDVRPENLSRPFEVADILRTFVPYRTTRAEVGVETAEDYEVLILRLLSGERGFVFTDDAMQDDLRRELDSGNPDLRALHAYGTAKLTLAQHAMRQVLESSPAVAAAGPAQTVLRDSEGRVVAALGNAAPGNAAPGNAAPGNAAPVVSVPAPHADQAPAIAPPLAPPIAPPIASPIAKSPLAPAGPSDALAEVQRQLPPTLQELGEVIGSSSEGKTRAPFHARGSRIPDATADAPMRTPRPGCRFCGQLLPDGREVTFCPHCGQNLKVVRCPGCSAEMEPAWKFCVTCGRAASHG